MGLIHTLLALIPTRKNGLGYNAIGLLSDNLIIKLMAILDRKPLILEFPELRQVRQSVLPDQDWPAMSLRLEINHFQSLVYV